MRHIIIRSVMGIVWIVAGIASLLRGDIIGLALGIIMGIVFIASALMMKKKTGKAVR